MDLNDDPDDSLIGKIYHSIYSAHRWTAEKSDDYFGVKKETLATAAYCLGTAGTFATYGFLGSAAVVITAYLGLKTFVQETRPASTPDMLRKMNGNFAALKAVFSFGYGVAGFSLSTGLAEIYCGLPLGGAFVGLGVAALGLHSGDLFSMCKPREPPRKKRILDRVSDYIASWRLPRFAPTPSNSFYS